MSRVYIEGRNKKADYQRITRWITKWRKRLHVTEWTIEIVIENKACKETDASITAAKIDSNERYRDAVLTIYTPFWTYPIKEQEHIIVHELIHLPLNRVDVLITRLICAELADREEVLDAAETLTETVANIVWDAYNK